MSSLHSPHSLQTSLHKLLHSGITEIVLPSESTQEYLLVLPMLAHLSRQSETRWFTWIAPRGINRKVLQDFGFALDKLRIVYTANDEETLWMLWDALSMGNSDTVVASHESLSAEDLRKLELAACKGQSQGLLLRHRPETAAW